jgi:ubiquinol-cytochrome c reductase cytochrome c1 subunit
VIGVFLLIFWPILYANVNEIPRGEVFFENYCSGCHSLRYYKPKFVVISMVEDDAQAWFGRMPPDLSLIARLRGRAWLYRYLTSFYEDKTRPFGANNFLLPNLSMPNVLYPLHKSVYFKRDLNDLLDFLVDVAEPVRVIRYRLGFWVLGFIGMLIFLLYKLKVLYWRNIV